MSKTPDKKNGQLLLRQLRLAKLISEDGGKTPLGKLMRKAGYSKEYSESPDKIKKTVSWQELMDEKIPDNMLAEKHQELLNKKEYIAIGKKGEREVVPTGEIDPNAVAKGLDMAYKLKRKYEPDKGESNKQITYNIISYQNIKISNDPT